MDVNKYCIGDTLVILFGRPMYDPYQGKQKDPQTHQKLLKQVVVHLIGNVQHENYNLDQEVIHVIRSSISENAISDSMYPKLLLTYYLHDNWTFPNPHRTDVVQNLGINYELGKFKNQLYTREITRDAYKYRSK